MTNSLCHAPPLQTETVLTETSDFLIKQIIDLKLFNFVLFDVGTVCCVSKFVYMHTDYFQVYPTDAHEETNFPKDGNQFKIQDNTVKSDMLRFT